MQAAPPTSCALLTPEAIVRSVRHLPAAPKVLPKLKRLLRDGNSALDQIVSLLRLDTGLATRVLQIANSPYFFTGARCLTIEHAVARVGFEEVYVLVSHAVTAQVLNRQAGKGADQVLNRTVTAYRMSADQMWAHSVCCALAAQALAERVGVDCKAAYTLGLLHGVGMIAIDEWAVRTKRNLKLAIQPFPGEATRSERAQLGFTQADVGAALLVSWDFPLEISDPVRFQYCPGAATSWPALAALLMAARWIRSAVLNPPGEELPPLPQPSQVRPAGVALSVLTDAVPLIAAELEAVRTVLEQADEVIAHDE